MSAPDDPQQQRAKLILKWHRELQLPLNRGDRAALRRAVAPDDAYRMVAFHGLYGRLAESVRDDEAVARLALALAEVNESTRSAGRTGAALGRALARRKGDRSTVSGDRMRLLATAEDPDQFLRLLRSAIVQLDRMVPLVDVADVVLDWHRPDRRAEARRQIFLGYFRADNGAEVGSTDDPKTDSIDDTAPTATPETADA